MLIDFLGGAELQIETDQQRAELIRALHEAAELSAGELAQKRYADSQNRPDQLTFREILLRYFCFSVPPSEEELFDGLRTGEQKARMLELANLVAGNCVNHPGRPSVSTLFRKNFCQKCVDGINAAVADVTDDIEPKGCFVTFKGGDTWAAISGTGCAHYVAHQLNIGRGSFRCLDDKTVRVTDVTDGLTEVDRAKAAVNDIWEKADETHCGLVVKVQPKSGSPPNLITIRHDSSDQGGVVEDDFDSHFGGKGTFNR